MKEKGQMISEVVNFDEAFDERVNSIHLVLQYDHDCKYRSSSHETKKDWRV